MTIYISIHIIIYINVYIYIYIHIHTTSPGNNDVGRRLSSQKMMILRVQGFTWVILPARGYRDMHELRCLLDVSQMTHDPSYIYILYTYMYII